MTPERFFEQASSAFARAGDRQGRFDRDYSVGGQHLRVQFAGTDLVRPLTRALDHLRVERDTVPDLTVMAWCAREPGFTPPAPRWDTAAVGAHGAVDVLSDARFSAHWMFEAGGLQMLDRRANQAVYWVRNSGDLPYWETGAPMRILLDGWFADRGLHMVHAAGVGDRRGVLLLAGRGGSGKSSTALRCLDSSLHYLSDDYVLIDPTDWSVHSLYNTGKVDAAALARMPFLAEHVTNPASLDRAKALMFVHEAFPHKLWTAPLPIRGIVLPRIDPTAAGGVHASAAAAALKALAPSTMLQSAHRTAGTLATLARLARAVPIHELTLSDDVENVPAQLAGLLPAPQPVRQPQVSVIIPAFDPGPHLAAALSSVEAQLVASQRDAIEVIVIDDGSTQDIAAAVAPFRDSLRIRLERTPNQGPSAARNHGVGLAQADLIAFLDADDLWPAGSLDARVGAMAASTDMVHGRLRNLIEAEDGGSGTRQYGSPRRSFNVGSMLFRRELFDVTGPLDEALTFSEDVDLLVRITEANLRRRPLETVCLYYRRHEHSLTGIMQAGSRSRAHLSSWAHILKRSLDRRRGSTDRPAAAIEPSVSVITVVKNGDRYIAEAIESVLAQTRPIHELIVVDGNSTDRTHEIVAAYPRARLIQQAGRGLADARNSGIAAASGDWIAFLDHDDRWTPDKLAHQLAAIAATPGAQFSMGQLEFFTDDGAPPPPGPALQPTNTPMPGPTPGTLMVHRELFTSLGVFDDRYAIGCDLEWIKRARESDATCAECSQVILYKRLHGTNLSNRAQDNKREIFDILRTSLKKRRS